MTKVLLALGSTALLAVGCSTVHDRTQDQKVSADGTTATQTRTQMRDTPNGATVRETEVQTRQVMTPAGGDATKRDPAK